MATQPTTLDFLRGLSTIPTEMRSAGAGIAAKQQMVDQATRPTVTPAAPVKLTPQDLAPQDLAHSQGAYGTRPGEMRLDSEGNPVSGFSGVNRKSK